MDVIILQDGLYHLYPVTKSWFIGVTLPETIDLLSLCDVLRNELTTYLNHINKHVMKDGSGIFYGCIQNQ
jgi:hypothetical protein